MLYLEIMRNILCDQNIGFGKNGYYLAASGSVSWNDLYCAMARGLAKRKVIVTDEVNVVDDTVLEQMGAALGCPKDMVALFLGGDCTLQARNGQKLGWKPQFSEEHILEMADEEVDIILQNS